MASHVPFLAVRPDDQFSSEVKTHDFAGASNSILPSSPSRILSNLTGSARAIPGLTNMDPAAATDAPHAPVMPASRLPSWIKFPLLCLIGLALSTLLYSLVADWAGFELAAVSRDVTDEWHIAALVAWKFGELSVGWAAGYDCEHTT